MPLGEGGTVDMAVEWEGVVKHPERVELENKTRVQDRDVGK